MRLSLGQELRMVQKQVLAPRMIQSMEILQLSILALQERIEQEMEENPILELQEEEPEAEPEPAAGEAEDRKADSPTDEERELVIDEAHSNEGDFERLLKMDEEWPDHFEERSHGSRGEIEEAGERKTDAMANMIARPQSLQDYLHDQLGWFDIEPELRAMADRIIYNLDTNGYLQGRLEDLLDPNGDDEQAALAQRALALVQKLDPPRRRRPRSPRVPAAAIDSRHTLLRATSNADRQPLGRPGAQPLAGDFPQDRLLDRIDPEGARRTAEAESQARAPISTTSSFRRSRPTCSSSRTRTADTACGWKTGDTPSLFISPYYRKLFQDPDTSEETREYIKRKINSAQWLIDSIEQRRNTLDEGRPGDRRLPEGVSRQGPRGDRAVEDAADRRQGRAYTSPRSAGRSTRSGFRRRGGFSP